MITHRGNVEHYQWGGQCDGWRLLLTAALSVIEERMPPAATEVAHYHASSVQYFRVLSGVLTMELDGREHAIHSGCGLAVSPRSVHRAVNHGATDCVFLVISSPATTNDRHEV